ncbi:MULTISPECIES: basic amino acid ABC transporter substrate-binding protein [unclassified Neisseria]|uniref:basic amino acid ABC transporter substrate-binding protein n=1 Tax=unclassified Neisseria TaxID=2623750 RepID=UPI002666DC4C|nr:MULTISPECIES: basic amino acid ABC transporter substrate-binding protein [unclassified Neisseria]MDO1510305.1 basic amino acid ABC transporter substrate-binding protein [Neisseria sp. MVDL19-042950]MDO1516474.1 basic amino acid ABC transporter substrate-binding protein [Neisseria sp. MVDL18-041461]MDO1563622.1 basic amino acid ABC transporter substrate-binding protein [Neisseria sp. MVDL20-010259]
MNMKKWIAAAVACSALALGACGGKGETAANTDKVYRVAMNAEFAPFESMDSANNIEGFDVDLVNALAKAGNFKVEYKHQPWDSLFPGLSNGDADILASAVTITDERKQTMDFSEPYFEITQVILVPKGKDINSVEDLKQVKKVGVVTGQTGDFAASKILGSNNSKISRYETLPLVVKELENGGLDAVISDSAVIGNYIKNNSDKGFSMVAVPDFEVEHYGLAVRKGDTATQTMLNEALKKVRESGEYDKIYDKYFAKQ